MSDKPETSIREIVMAHWHGSSVDRLTQALEEREASMLSASADRKDEAVRLNAALTSVLLDRDRLALALSKIDAIRNSIIGTQSINWSAHVYPLVAALYEAGYEGEGYDVAREKAKTLIEERDEAIRLIEQLRAAAKLALEELDTEYVADREETQEVAQKALRLALQASDGKGDGS